MNNMKYNLKRRLLTATVTASIATTAAVSAEVTDATVSVKAMADALHLVMDSDRSVYTKKIVNRLVKKEKVIKASEHFEDDKALVLPAQMFRFGSELAAKRAEKLDDVNFSYTLQSMWPINKQNAPKTEAEKVGLKFVAENKGKIITPQKNSVVKTILPPFMLIPVLRQYVFPATTNTLTHRKKISR